MKHFLVCVVFVLCFDVFVFSQMPETIADTFPTITETEIFDDGTSTTNTVDTKAQEILLLRKGFWFVMAIIAFIAFYVWAVIRVQAGRMKVIVGWKDLIMLLVMWILIGIQYLNIERYDGELLGRTISIVVMIAIMVMLLISIVLTLRGNAGFFNILYALIMKLIVIPLVPISFIVALCQISSIGDTRGTI